MPHLRSRYLEGNIRKDLSWSPVVSVLGMRQVGKSTLLQLLGKSYITLDDNVRLQKLERGDWSEVESSNPPLVIDEAQKSPNLFDRVKLLVDRSKRPGQFVLTGSVRFLSRKQIRESLTGRTTLLELLPLTMSESHSGRLNDFVGALTRLSHSLQERDKKVIEHISSRKHCSIRSVDEYAGLGGMPGICFKRDEVVRSKMREAHIETLLMRDLQFLIRTRIPYVKLRAILTSMATLQGQLFSISAIARQVQLSTPTVIQIIRALQDLFMIRLHGNTYFFTDCGMGSFLGASRIENPLFHMERFIYQELYAQLSYLYQSQFRMEMYLSRGGVRIPFVIQIKDHPLVAITADPSEGASEKSLKGLTWFSKRKERVIGVVLHRGKSAYFSSTGAVCIPYNWIV